jgi:hypothetical protein
MKKPDQPEDSEDLHCLSEAKEADRDTPTIGIDELQKRIGARPTRFGRCTKKRD